MRGDLERLSRELKLDSRVFFLGSVEDDAVAAWYAACDVFVLPSVTRAEAFGLVQLEAMARAKPVISTRLATGVPWVNVDGITGIVVPPGDSEALAAALQTLAGDPEMRARMGRAARVRFEQEFTRERMIDRTVAMYERVMTEPVPSPSPLMKRAFDIALSGVGLILSAPVWALAAAAIKLEDGGPVFFRQPRVGQNGTLFTVLKFRSMIVRDERDHALRQASAGDSRITRIGRLMRATAMDELPQLVNIFKGDMSFVGPRALMPGEIETGGDGQVVAMEEIRGLPRTHRRSAGPDRYRADLRAARRDAATQVPLRSALRQAPVFLAGHPAHTAVVLDQHARHVGASSAQVLATREWDVLIVGAGPAGLSAARLLAAERLSVLVLEEHDADRRPGALHRRARPRRVH